MLETPFKLVVQIAATIRWVCPMCGFLTRSKVTYGHYWIRCKSPACLQKYLVGVTLHVPIQTHGERYIPPPDVTIPDSVEAAEAKGHKYSKQRNSVRLAPDAICEPKIWQSNQPIQHVTETQAVEE